MHFFRLVLFSCLINFQLAAQVPGLIGTWQAKDKNEIVLLVLKEDNTGSFDGIPFSYKTEGNELIATFDHGDFNYDYELKEKQLILKEGNLEHPYTFVKIKGVTISQTSSSPAISDPALYGIWTNSAYKVIFDSKNEILINGEKMKYEAKEQKLKIYTGNQSEEKPYTIKGETLYMTIKGQEVQLKKDKFSEDKD